MKVTIELTEAQVKGIKDYLKEVSGEINPKVAKGDIQAEIKGLLDSSLQTGAISDYILNYEK